MGEEQQGFRRGRGTTDGMFTQKMEGQENMALGFIDPDTMRMTGFRERWPWSR